MSRAADSWPEADAWPPPEEDSPRPGQPDQETLSVCQVGERIQGLLAAGFPGSFWLAGETSGLSRTVSKAGRTGHWYFQLVDPGVDDPRRRPSLELKCWRRTIDGLFGPRGRLRQQLQPVDGIVLRLRVKADFYPPRGQISFTVEDIDPDYTLGNLDQQRRELLRRLEADGSLRTNKARLLCEVPLRLGLITSAGSAAHHDVLQTLQASGIGFELSFCDARTQGADTGPSVAGALASLGALPLDAILLVRGGGSRLDLSWFDKEQVARAIAACPYPVLTGIGHEIDSSVADAVAHQSFKTPTAVAEFVVSAAWRARDEIEQAAQWIERHAASVLEEQTQVLVRGARLLQLGAQQGVGSAEGQLASLAHRMRERTHAALEGCAEHLAGARAVLRSPVHDERIGHRLAELERHALRLGELCAGHLQRHDQLLEGCAERARLLDPHNVLARGFAWLRRADGKILKDAARVRPAELLVAVMRDGELPLQHRPPADHGESL